ncbi:actin regulatory protein [Gloeophyllum trabeum ATCC 11539]|uniref:Actin regulatory protein n=1 Tax=Gloeophyllum trabeum (strain ATCC 11539 / FP-39264 / Madison 617) TaxID=670483 RepID=S7Q4I6_GLOTA|nr:actin regulatory protein [Gloeophyllum trabeum ATCC 11539]EPQ54417.1 actin regulatory protein [Gloeophyllum trabeum ATCC 11539]
MEGERLSQHPKFNIEDTNIALLGSDLERRVREHAGDKEVAWETAGKAPGLDVWRVEHFRIAKWPRERHGTFYDGDSYLVLHTYKNHNETDALAYDLHFWLGKDTSQDEAGTAAYKTVELDDYLNGQPVQYREVQGFESSRFLSYFPHFITLHGGISTGFHHVSAPPPAEVKKLYKIQISQPPYNHLVVREVPAEASSIVQGAVYVLDEGTKALQFNTKESVGKERFKAAEFVRLLVNERQSQPQVIVYDEGASGAGIFLSEFESDAVLPAPVKPRQAESTKASLYRLSDASGRLVFESMGGFTGLGSLSSGDVYLIDNTADICQPAIYVWIGKSASLNERRLVMQYAQQYLYKAGAGAAVSIVKIAEGMENNRFLINLGGSA